MAVKYKLTRPELKRFRDALARYERYLPMLKLKQQQLQMSQRDIQRQRREAREEVRLATEAFTAYEPVLADTAGVDVRKLAEPQEVRTNIVNIAGVEIPVFQDAVFPKVTYSLFGTPAWVDRALADLRDVNRKKAILETLDQQYRRIARELTRIVQRVNLFEKVKIPEAREAIRVIGIRLGDEMTAAVGRAKIAKSKIADVMERETDMFLNGSAEDEGEGNEAATGPESVDGSSKEQRR
jgi:V/A-type H+/Na+-transporting ATPase subunit D